MRSPAIASFSAPALRIPSRSSQSLGLFEHREQLRVRRQRRDHVGLALVRELQHEAGRQRVQREVRQAAGRRHHVALEVVAPAAEPVQRQRIPVPVHQQARLVGLPARLVDGNRLLAGDPLPGDRCVLRDDVPHAAFDGSQFGRREVAPAAHLAVVAGGRRRRVLDEDLAPREHLVERDEHQERQRAAIDADAVRRRRVEGRDGRVPVERKGQLTEAAVDDGGHEGPRRLTVRRAQHFTRPACRSAPRTRARPAAWPGAGSAAARAGCRSTSSFATTPPSWSNPTTGRRTRR